MARSEIVYKKSMHIGVAVDTPRGLLVPVIRDVDRKGIIELAAELAKVVREGARRQAVARRNAGRRVHDHQSRRHRRHVVHADRQLARSGDSRHFARLAGACLRTDHAFEPRLMLPLSLSYDHRVIDGADAARFLRWVVRGLRTAVRAVAVIVMSSSTQVVVIGAGPGGYAAAFYAADRGMQVTLVDPAHESRRRLPLSRVHPVEGAAARRRGDQRGEARGGMGRHVRRAEDRRRQGCARSRRRSSTS